MMAASGLATPGAGDQTSAPVDLAHLAHHTFGNRDLEHEVLRLFARQSQVWMERLKETLDADQRGEMVHSIKGSARGIGAWRVADLAEQLECDVATADTDPAGDLFADLEAAIGKTNAFIRDLLQEAP